MYIDKDLRDVINFERIKIEEVDENYMIVGFLGKYEYILAEYKDERIAKQVFHSITHQSDGSVYKIRKNDKEYKDSHTVKVFNKSLLGL